MPAKKNFYFVIHSWMLDQLDLSLGDAAVFAYIYGLTNSTELNRKGWYGSQRRLAKILHTSPSTINSIIKRLEDKSYIQVDNTHITSLVQEPAETKPQKSVQNPDTSEQILDVSAQIRDISAQISDTYNIK